jgi:hypothetical protein
MTRPTNHQWRRHSRWSSLWGKVNAEARPGYEPQAEPMMCDWDGSGSCEHWPHRRIAYQMFPAAVGSTHSMRSSFAAWIRDCEFQPWDGHISYIFLSGSGRVARR